MGEPKTSVRKSRLRLGLVLGLACVCTVVLLVLAVLRQNAAWHHRMRLRWSTLNILWQNVIYYAQEHGRFPASLYEVGDYPAGCHPAEAAKDIVYLVASVPYPQEIKAPDGSVMVFGVRVFYEKRSQRHSLTGSGYFDFYAHPGIDYSYFYREAPPGPLDADAAWSLVDTSIYGELKAASFLGQDRQSLEFLFNTDGDGRTNLWFRQGRRDSYDRDGNGTLDVSYRLGSRTGYDTDDDGEPDKWVHSGDLEGHPWGWREVKEPKTVRVYDTKGSEVVLELRPRGWIEHAPSRAQARPKEEEAETGNTEQ